MPDVVRNGGVKDVSVVGRLLRWAAASRARTLGLVGFSLAATGAVDYATGYRFAFSPLYLFPVLIASAALGRPAGLSVALTAAFIWTLAQHSPGAADFSWQLFAWNTVMRFAVLGFVAWLLGALEREMLAARHDYLTHLFNRRHFMQSLEAERSRSDRTGVPFSVLSLDLDRFKTLNDTLGHAVGDEALRVVAGVLSDSARAMDVSARMGGDEFSVLLPEADADVAEAIAQRLLAGCADEFRRRGWPIGISIGIATGVGAAETIDDLLRRADDSMYEQKQARRHGSVPAAAAGEDDRTR